MMKIEDVKNAKRLKLTWNNQNTGLYEKNTQGLWIRIDINATYKQYGVTDEQMKEYSNSEEYTIEILPSLLKAVEFDNDRWSN